MIRISLISILFSLSAMAQSEPFVLEATTDKNVFLFFPSPITKALPGNADFRFGYNQETAEKFGVLKAVGPRGESTLHVITDDQSVYSFVVRYNPNTSIFEYFFDGSESVGNIDKKQKPNSRDDISDSSIEGKKIIDSDYYGETDSKQTDFEFCKELLARKDFYKNFYKKQSDVVLRLTNIGYRKDKTFICLAIENNSTLDYDLNFIQFNKVAKKASRKSNYQAIEIKPIPNYSYQKFERVASMETKRAVYVFEKLSIDKNKLINIEINELKGERNIQLAVGDQFINNPNK
ncbi:hypothetical protein HME9304_01796 [Flagellimonas maritima]|uniref:DUF4138 domain-containing protein n=1 Tax=Flagellimonas maritima TaxID=1383885 RepID=A0A2Z4LSA4_9FLAO|nr:DUF4138 domain-containing protein [Allomuricauda aurantiaca]AWX44791.1 hypothetical protein HME9304_01796 [Allomuricauda aurantiaca]